MANNQEMYCSHCRRNEGFENEDIESECFEYEESVGEHFEEEQTFYEIGS